MIKTKWVNLVKQSYFYLSTTGDLYLKYIYQLFHNKINHLNDSF